jgi:hypothetical protein
LPRAADHKAVFPIVLLLLALGGFPASALAQTSESEIWPQVQAFVSLNSETRVFLLSSFRANADDGDWQGSFGIHLDIALKPAFRRELRFKQDSFGKRLLFFRGGFRYITSLSGQPHLEHRWLVELNSRYPLPGKVVVSDRNRGELRFISRQTFSTRYRNRLQIERESSFGPVLLTPYVNGELFYDTRYDIWNRNRYSAGVRIPAGNTLTVDAYYLRQNDSRSNPPHINAFGLTFNLYF